MDDSDYIDWIRFWLNLEEDDLSTDDINTLLQSVQAQYTTATECQTKYYLAVAVLRHLIRLEAKGTSGTVGSGAISQIREKIGKREKEVYYDVSTSSSTSSGWSSVLEDLEANPNVIGCEVFPTDSSTTDGATGIVKIGVSVDKYTHSTPWRQKLNNPYSTYGSNW